MSQDPSTDIENVNAAYRVQYELANRYRTALEEIADLIAANDGYVLRGEIAHIALTALAFDPLEGVT